MDSIVDVFSIAAAMASIILAIAAISYSWQSEKKSMQTYERTIAVLEEISQKSAVIESAVSETQSKLVDTVIANATPRQSYEEMMMQAFLPMVQQNPEWLRELIEASTAQESSQTTSRPQSRCR